MLIMYTTKEQIIGLHFYHKSNIHQEYIIDYDGKKIVVRWEGSSSGSTNYSVEDALENLNIGFWKVINNEPNYEIY